MERSRLAAIAAAAKAASEPPPPPYGSGISVAGGPAIEPGAEGSDSVMSDAVAPGGVKPVAVSVRDGKAGETLMVDALTDLQRDTLISFKGVTNASNHVSCIRLLTAHNWNLNV